MTSVVLAGLEKGSPNGLVAQPEVTAIGGPRWPRGRGWGAPTGSVIDDGSS